MAIKPNFTPAQVAAEMQKKVAVIERQIVDTLSKEGEKFVRNARLVNTYKDQTGNLRSSIGYVLLKDGRQITGSAFEVVKDGHKGSQIGRQTAADAARKYTKGYVLIVVAGMDYAVHVEKGGAGLDVLTNSAKQAEIDLKQALEKLASKISR